MTAPWLTLIGIGEDGRAGLSPAAIAASGASASRRRRRAPPRAGRAARLRNPVWPSPMDAAYPQILARRGEKVCVLASGDPFFYGVGSVLAKKIPAEEMLCLPAPSSFSLAAARLGWALQDCALVTLHGRPLEKIIPHLHDGAKIIALSWDGATPRTTRRAVDAARLRRVAADGLRTSRRPARARPRDVWPAIFPSLTSRRSTRWRSISWRIATPASCRARPACRTIFSSMTARSPNANSAR